MTTHHHHSRKNPARLATWIMLAFAYVYVAWGATYMAVHVTLNTLPPFIMSGSRFTLAGLMLLAFVALFHRKEFHWGSGREWRDAAVTGGMLLVGGNGAVAWAQQHVSTSISALIFGSMPLCIIFFDWIRPKGTTPTLRTCCGLALGFIGLCILLQPSGGEATSHLETLGKIALVFAACSWSAGAIYSRHLHAKGSPLLPMGRQMLSGGLMLLIVSLIHGDWIGFSVSRVSFDSWMGFGYLVIFGSLLGFTAYQWLMRVSTPTYVSTVSYVNIVVAVLIAWTIGHETMTLHVFLGAIIIVGSVMLVLTKRSARATVNAAPSEA
jgi:drug/metabolite transporter (DMT)-like permease